MKKFLDLSSWSRKAAIGSMLIMAFAVVGCDDSSSASAGHNDEPGVESSSSSSGKAGEPAEPAEEASSSSEKAKSSSSKEEKESKASSSSVKSEFSSSDENSQSSSSSSADVQSSSSEIAVNSSSSVSDASSSSLDFDWSLPKETYLNPEIEYDTIIDSRDGKVYRTVKIGNQTWMAENLNFDPGQGGSGDAKYDWSWCYDDVPEHCDVAGRLYTWAAAIDSVKLANDAENPQECGYGKNCNLPAKVQGVCPPDWHLPTQAEWNTLFLSVGGQYQSTAGKALKSQSGWYKNGNGTDAFGFSALPAGDKYYKGDFSNEGRLAEFWSSTEYINSDEAYHMDLSYEDGYANLSGYAKNYGESVRCVKD